MPAVLQIAMLEAAVAEAAEREEAALAECRELEAALAELQNMGPEEAAQFAGSDSRRRELEYQVWELQRALDEALVDKRRLNNQLKERVSGLAGREQERGKHRAA